MKNTEVFGYLRESILSEPSFTTEGRAKENDALNLMYSDVDKGVMRDTREIGTIVIDEPQVANAFIAVLFDRVIRDGVTYGLNAVNKLARFKSDNLDYGANWSKLAVDTYDVVAYDSDASPIPKAGSRVGTCFSSAPVQKKVQFTFSNDQIKLAFSSQNGIEGLLEAMVKAVRDSLELHMYGALKNEVILSDATSEINVNYVTQNIDIGASSKLVGLAQVISRTDGNILLGGITSDTTVPADAITEAQLFGLKELRARIVDDALAMSEAGTTYNYGDYAEVSGTPVAGTGPFTTNLPLGTGVLVINAKVLSAMDLAGDSLFGSTGNYTKYFQDVIPIYVNTATGKASAQTFAYAILDPKALEYKYLLEKTLTFENPNGLYTNYFSHLWYGVMANPFVSALVKFFKK